MSYTTLQSAIRGIEDSFVVRYVTLAGVVIMLYDHILTFHDEYQYIWKARHSVEKYAFLLNRYLITSVMLATLHEMCGFNNVNYTDTGCKILLFFSICAGTTSCIVGNLLILHRVLELWKDSLKTRLFIHGMHLASACVHISMTVLVSIVGWPYVIWSPVVKMCNISGTPTSFPAMWGAPLFFELSVIILVIYNTLATPRSADIPLRRALQKNGLLFFLFVIILRLPSVVVSGIARGSISVFGVYFVWTGTTMFFNRSILRLHEAEMNAKLMLLSSCLEKNWLIHGPASELGCSVGREESQTDVSSDSCSHMFKDSPTRDSVSEKTKF